MASNSNDWVDLPQSKGSKDDWQDLPPKGGSTSPDAADKATQGMKTGAQAISNTPESPLASYLRKGVGALTALRGGLVKGATLGNVDPGQVGPLDVYGSAEKEHPVATGVGQLAGSVIPGTAVGAAAGAIAPMGSGVLPSLGRTATSAGAGALQGAMQNPGPDGSRLPNAKMGALLSGGMSAAGEMASPVLNKISDVLMKKALGIRKDFTVNEGDKAEGIGNRLIDLGVGGTKSTMQNQVSEKYAQTEKNIQELTGQLQDVLDPKELADAVSQHSQGLSLTNGKALPGKEGDLKYVRDIADQYSNMGGLTPKDYLTIKRGGGFTNAGNPGASLADKVDRTVAGVARDRLGSLDPSITGALGDERALILAGKPLNNPGAIHQGLGSQLFFGKAVPAIGSLGAGALRGVSQNSTDPVLQQAALSGLFGLTNKQ